MQKKNFYEFDLPKLKVSEKFKRGLAFYNSAVWPIASYDFETGKIRDQRPLIRIEKSMML